MKSTSPSTGYTEAFTSQVRLESLRGRSQLFRSDDHDAVKPDGVRGKWWHECVRGLAAVQTSGEGLNLVVLRVGEAYGPGYASGNMLARMVIGHTYKYL
jgi:hypothetical protein